ncbi:MAG: hypothetical protein HYY65_01195 [Candidatus Tectomicrobia bacterium]|uniref:Uroporphyrinogen decarboxylase (URO-D) domain-containing protein n=1 Tax=Tectimicrobiota bacterium TaxID=2528274 RepID=A0A932M073_UNCTE|nr:hypothetical protein [Candidatus Tectomicrobia bacterium]
MAGTLLEMIGGGGRPFFPLVYRLAGALEQVSAAELERDPGTLTRCLRSAQRLFGYRIVSNHFDRALLAEACGASCGWEAGEKRIAVPLLSSVQEMERFRPAGWEERGAVPVVLEATRRLLAEFRGSPRVAGVVPGPFLLARQLAGASFLCEFRRESAAAEELVLTCGEVSLGLLKKFCEIRTEVLLLLDAVPAVPGNWGKELLADLFRPQVNVANYFEAPLVMALDGPADLAVLDSLAEVQVDAVAFLTDQPAEFFREAAGRVNCPIGVPLSAPALAGEEEALKNRVSWGDSLGREWFFVTPGEMDPEIPAQQFHNLMKLLTTL